MATILVIDDEQDLLDLLGYNLAKEGYKVLVAKDGEKGLDLAKRHKPDLIILDLMMPKIDGLEVCKSLQNDSKTSAIPIIMLTAKAEETDKIVGLELGADDYVTKPFSVRELLARVKAHLRRVSKTQESKELHKLGNLTIDVGKRKVFSKKSEIILTTTEFNILVSLVERQGRVMTRDDLISNACGFDSAITDRKIDVHIATLRKKIGKH